MAENSNFVTKITIFTPKKSIFMPKKTIFVTKFAIFEAKIANFTIKNDNSIANIAISILLQSQAYCACHILIRLSSLLCILLVELKS